ncbi:hypothetical protein PUR61_18730 [Streptomyces sp. BE20]|uniref:hypothetical protein n=1 Tax=Streptomyces sp. BE20 TaxID=3002525 RepID=UPI002E7728C4|nr:hypothetical protein [Streptomyces sp. BE20]MEE1824203.1 hypothetical protein [Streptomyces sp. BE20]
MWLADPPADLDGADALTERSPISLLRRNKGDEVAEAGESPEHSHREERPD